MSGSVDSQDGIEDSPLRLWLDDVRRPPSEMWAWAKSVVEAITVLEAGTIIEISFDNDLHPFERDGLEVCEWMEEHGIWPSLAHVHTDNRVARTKMCHILERNGYRRLLGRHRSFTKGDGSETRLTPKQFAELNFKNSPKAMEKLR